MTHRPHDDALLRERIARQHEQLATLIGDIRRSASLGGTGYTAGLLASLEPTIRQHFHDEEQALRLARPPGLQEHLQEHRLLVLQLHAQAAGPATRTGIERLIEALQSHHEGGQDAAIVALLDASVRT